MCCLVSQFTYPSPFQFLRKQASLILIEKLMRFLWLAEKNRTRTNCVRWSLVCLPKEKRGLGIRSVKEVNDACVLKLGWAASTSSLWATWFRQRCFRNSSIWSRKTTSTGSCIWKRIRALSLFLQNESKWTVGNGTLISFWYDRWLDHDPISHFLFLISVSLH